MKIDIITIFPNIFDSFLKESLLARAQLRRPKGSESRPKASGNKPLLTINLHNLRKWTDDKHQTVDGRPYGGGAGMVLKIEPIYKAVKALTLRQAQGHRSKTRIVLLSAKGKTFDQKKAQQLSKYDQIIFICGRYEGVDERVAKYIVDEEISIGNYVLFGGEVPAMVIMEAVSRLIPGVVAKEESVKNESFSDKEAKAKEYPQYTRPEVFIPKLKTKNYKLKTSWKVPPVLLSGDHKKIAEWRNKNSK